MDKNRFLAEKIDRLLALFPVVAVVGVRQCGKSTLVQMLRPDWKYYDLERPDDFRLVSDDPLGFFSLRPHHVIIDEAQEFPQLFQTLRGIIDRDRKSVGRYLLTGSSSPDIVRGLSETLAGRMATVELWPFKAGEYYDQPLSPIYDLLIDKVALNDLTALSSELTQSQIYAHWLFGGYPEPRIKSREISEFNHLWMNEYFADYIRRDIRRLFPRINIHHYRLFIQALVHRSGTFINASEIARSLGVSSVTASEYLEIIHGTFIWRNLRSFEKNPYKSVQKMLRGYYRDSGILHHQLRIRNIDDLLTHPQAGRSFESFMIEEIIRGFQCRMETGIEFHYYRTRDKSELDLIVEGAFGIIPFEIKLGHRTDRRMMTALKLFIKDTKAPFGILVNNAEKIEILDQCIIQIPARFF